MTGNVAVKENEIGVIYHPLSDVHVGTYHVSSDGTGLQILAHSNIFPHYFVFVMSKHGTADAGFQKMT